MSPAGPGPSERLRRLPGVGRAPAVGAAGGWAARWPAGPGYLPATPAPGGHALARCSRASLSGSRCLGGPELEGTPGRVPERLGAVRGLDRVRSGGGEILQVPRRRGSLAPTDSTPPWPPTLTPGALGLGVRRGRPGTPHPCRGKGRKGRQEAGISPPRASPGTKGQGPEQRRLRKRVQVGSAPQRPQVSRLCFHLRLKVRDISRSWVRAAGGGERGDGGG